MITFDPGSVAPGLGPSFCCLSVTKKKKKINPLKKKFVFGADIITEVSLYPEVLLDLVSVSDRSYFSPTNPQQHPHPPQKKSILTASDCYRVLGLRSQKVFCVYVAILKCEKLFSTRIYI